MASALSNLNTLSLHLPSQKKRHSGSTSIAAASSNSPFHRLLPSPLRRPMILAVKAMGPESRDSLDELQRASNMRRQQQQPSSQPPKRRVAQSAPIGMWDRFPSARTVQQMMETMDRIMDDPFAYNGTSLPSLSSDEGMQGYRRGRIPWEIKEGEGEYKMRFDMPGMTKNDVKVWVEEKMLVLKAEKLVREGEEEEDEWSPKSYGRYNSRIALPENVEVEKIKAEVKDGVLYMTIPKASSSSKVLDINVQ